MLFFLNNVSCYDLVKIQRRKGRANALENAFAMYDLRGTMYDLFIMCALRRFFSDH